MTRSFLDECEKEALHLSGAIQPHGTLLAVDAQGVVTHVAENVASYLTWTVNDLMGNPLPIDLSKHLAGMDSWNSHRRFICSAVDGVDGILDLSINRNQDGLLLLELTPQQEDTPALGKTAPVTPDDFASEEAIVAARQSLLNEIASLTGAHRVLYYHFHESADGEVLGETRDSQVYGSYLGLHFPASDIPQIARTLYLKNPWRQIPDARTAPVSIISRDAATLDLSRSDLRSVSPVHSLYLANMGVVASLSFPVVISNSLSALIAVHHRSPLPLPHSLIEDISTLVKSFGFSLGAFHTRRRMRLVDNLIYRFNEIKTIVHRHGDLMSAWPEIAPILEKEFKADGLTVIHDNFYFSHGITFEPQALEAFDQWFCDSEDQFVWNTDNLIRRLPAFPISEIAGVLALRIFNAGKNQGLRIYLTRTEFLHEVVWGGNPDKPVEYHDGTYGIAPRRSFEKWIETRIGHSHPWDNEARLLALKLRELITGNLY